MRLLLLWLLLHSLGYAAYQEKKDRRIGSLMSNCIRQRPHAQKSVIRELEALQVTGLPVDSTDERGNTALMTCAALGNVPLVAQWLLEHKADPLCKDKKGRTPLAIALGAGSKSGSLAALLSSHESMRLYSNEPACINGKITNYLDGVLHSKLKDCHKGRVVKNVLVSGERWIERKQILDSLKSKAIRKTLAQLYSLEELHTIHDNSVHDSFEDDRLRDQSIYEWQQQAEAYLTPWLPDGNGSLCTNKHRDIIRSYLIGWDDEEYDTFIIHVALSYGKSKHKLIDLVKKYPILCQPTMNLPTMMCAMTNPALVGPLKDAGVPIDQQYDEMFDKETILMGAAHWDNDELVKMLLHHKARIDILDIGGQDALLHAMYYAQRARPVGSIHTLLEDPRMTDIINREFSIGSDKDSTKTSYLTEAMLIRGKHERDSVIAKLLHLGARVGQLELDRAVACARDLSRLLPKSSLDDIAACYQKFLATDWQQSWFFDVRSHRKQYMYQALTSANKSLNHALKPWIIPERADIVREYLGLQKEPTVKKAKIKRRRREI